MKLLATLFFWQLDFMSQKIVLIFLLVASTFAIAAEDETSKFGLALKLAHLIDYSSQWRSFEAKCKQIEHPELDPYAMYNAKPDVFGGISPVSKYWPRIQNIYRNFQSSMCDAMQLSDIDQSVANELSKDLTESDLIASINFFSSPEGRHLRFVTAQAIEVTGEFVQKSINKHTVEINNSTSKALKDLVQEFHENGE